MVHPSNSMFAFVCLLSIAISIYLKLLDAYNERRGSK